MEKIIYSLFLLLSTSLISCRPTKYITKEVPIEVIKEVPVEVIKTEYINNTTVDNTLIRDSVDRYLNGDTLVIYKEKQIIKYKYKADTLVVRDTIPIITEIQVPVTIREEVVKEVKTNKLYWYHRIFICLGILSFIHTGILLIIKYLKK